MVSGFLNLDSLRVHLDILSGNASPCVWFSVCLLSSPIHLEQGLVLAKLIAAWVPLDGKMIRLDPSLNNTQVQCFRQTFDSANTCLAVETGGMGELRRRLESTLCDF